MGTRKATTDAATVAAPIDTTAQDSKAQDAARKLLEAGADHIMGRVSAITEATESANGGDGAGQIMRAALLATDPATLAKSFYSDVRLNKDGLGQKYGEPTGKEKDGVKTFKINGYLRNVITIVFGGTQAGSAAGAVDLPEVEMLDDEGNPKSFNDVRKQVEDIRRKAREADEAEAAKAAYEALSAEEKEALRLAEVLTGLAATLTEADYSNPDHVAVLVRATEEVESTAHYIRTGETARPTAEDADAEIKAAVA